MTTYIKVKDPAHPLRDGRDEIFEHRRVLSAELGLGPQNCHWCLRIVLWVRPANLTFKDWMDLRLEVDHLDGNGQNNVRSNLVPSCHSCNQKRREASQPLEFGVRKVPGSVYPPELPSLSELDALLECIDLAGRPTVPVFGQGEKG